MARRPSWSCIYPTEVDIKDIYELLILHVSKRLIAKDAGVVDEDIDTPVLVDNCLHDSITVFVLPLTISTSPPIFWISFVTKSGSTKPLTAIVALYFAKLR